MIDIILYRYRIGTFSQKLRNRKSAFINRFEKCYQDKSGKLLLSCLQVLFKLLLLWFLLPDLNNQVGTPLLSGQHPGDHQHVLGQLGGHQLVWEGPVDGFDQQFISVGKKLTVNFKAKYTYGNKEDKRGIKNIHLNIRSLSNKVTEVKNIIREHKPHILGLSECELKKLNGIFDEGKLKVPGYDLLFPKSWSQLGFARVVIYVKKTLQYQQVHELEDDLVQTVWLRGGFKSSKTIYFCHGYREHTSTLGSSIRDQKQQLEMFLSQWEEAAVHNNPSQPNEVHISCDMNLDALNDRWLRPDYHLVTLARLVHTSCHVGNMSQLVTVPTRFQYNSVKDETSISCIDHVYTNSKFRCSNVTVIPFGGSDHDAISYIRYSKMPPSPARTIRKRSYKNFDQASFLTSLSQVDWSEVYQCQDADLSAEILTRKFVEVLNIHAPWVLFQQRKFYKPWITDDTKELINNRDKFKKHAEELSIAGDTIAARDAWSNFKKLRNKVNNKKKFDEKKFKTGKVEQSLDSPANIWRTAKGFMDWESSGGPPSQLNVENKLITKASHIATFMNEFFIHKVKKIRDGIQFLPNAFEKCKTIMMGKSCKLELGHVTLDKVNKLLKNLKNSRSTSIDELDNFCVKISADVIDKPLHHVITLSILQQKFPRSWKFSKVIPLHKKGCKLERKNYRPVAILSPLSKILEKVIYEQL
jgi:hypothetical protein